MSTLTSATSVPGVCPRCQEPMVIVTVPALGATGLAVVGAGDSAGTAVLAVGAGEADALSVGVPDGVVSAVGEASDADAETDAEGEEDDGEGESRDEGVELATVVDVSCGRAATAVAPPATAATIANSHRSHRARRDRPARAA
ncbi:hypothetical protein ACWCQ4_33790, partial [Streptomyces aureus]